MGINTTTWQNALKTAITDPQELITLLELDAAFLLPAQQAAKLFPLRVPRGFVARMKKGDVHDPLLKQILPIGTELQTSMEFTADPLHEKNVNPLPGLLHKYKNRVLLTVTSACAVNCRYCFRREFAYSDNNPGTKGYEKIMAYIAADVSINEVILSGGDPLVASDDHLAALIQQLAQIDHVKLLRIHSRLPIVLPERITPSLIAVLKSTRLKPVLVLHCNHANEIAEDVRHILQQLHQAGITLLNQSVLLKDVNDNAEVLIELSEKLFAANVLPYYLHLLDKVNGTQHFEVEEGVAKALHWEMMQHLPGYLVPRLVREVPGAPAKIPVNSHHL
jgi:EF-P beta-lysylation protein EpmB